MIIGIGADIVNIQRIEKAVERHGEMFIDKVFTEEEASAFKAEKLTSARVASSFAAKEAVLKALGTGMSNGIGFRDVEVKREKGESPEIKLYGKAKELAESLGVKKIHLTLSHDGGIAAAFTLFEG